eukprot:760647-Hanusia_phi.AAC.3
MASAAIAAAAKKRAEKLGIRNEEVDETNVGKAQETELAHPFFSKLKDTPGKSGQLSPRSRRLAELQEKDQKENSPPPEQNKPSQAPAPAPAPAPPPAPAPAPAPQTAIKNVISLWILQPRIRRMQCKDCMTWQPVVPSSSRTLSNIEEVEFSDCMTQDALSVIKRWTNNPDTRFDMAGNPTIFSLLADIAMGPHEKVSANLLLLAVLMIHVAGKRGSGFSGKIETDRWLSSLMSLTAAKYLRR